MTYFRCPEALYGMHGLADVYGRCPWCGHHIERPAPKPDGFPVSELTEAYDEYYDPDWGGKK